MQYCHLIENFFTIKQKHTKINYVQFNIQQFTYSKIQTSVTKSVLFLQTKTIPKIFTKHFYNVYRFFVRLKNIKFSGEFCSE